LPILGLDVYLQTYRQVYLLAQTLFNGKRYFSILVDHGFIG
jgi:hypothetical protein